jgi:hypothetical protein
MMCDEPEQPLPTDETPVDGGERRSALPVAAFGASGLLPSASPTLPSALWRRRAPRVLLPVIGVAVLSALGIAALAAEGTPLREVGIALPFALPTLVSTLVALMRPHSKKRETASDAAVVHGVNVLFVALCARELFLLVVLLSPLLFVVATLPTALATKAVVTRALAHRDRRALERSAGQNDDSVHHPPAVTRTERGALR